MSPRDLRVSAPPDRPAGLRLTEGAWALAGVLLAHGVALGALDTTTPPEGLRAAGVAKARVETKTGAAGAVVVSRLAGPASPVGAVNPVGSVGPVGPAGPVGPVEARAPSRSIPPAAAPLAQRVDRAPGGNLSPAAPDPAEAATPPPAAGAARLPLQPAPAEGPSAAALLPAALPAAHPAVPPAVPPAALPAALPAVLPAVQPAGAVLQTAALPAEGEAPALVYDTLVPPPFRLLFALRRGALSGQAELVMQRTAAGYALDLKGTALGLEVLGMSSRGGVGPNGLMPERFVDRRRGKDRLAANFDHAAGRITYSGTPAAQALWPGGQDRLSWMVQLAAIVEAAPARYPAGSRIALSVSGARGDVDTWTFLVQGRQRLNLPAGPITEALHLTREPRRPYDTQVEVWLHPTRHHLPMRARLTVLPGGETLELTLAAP